MSGYPTTRPVAHRGCLAIRFLPMRQIAKSALFWLFLVGVHFVVAVGAGMLIGWGPELLFDRYYLNTGVQAFSPAIAFTALVLAFVVGPKIKGGRGATFVWAPTLVRCGTERTCNRLGPQLVFAEESLGLRNGKSFWSGPLLQLYGMPL